MPTELLNAVDHDPLCQFAGQYQLWVLAPRIGNGLQLTEAELGVLLGRCSEMGVANGLMVKILLATATHWGASECSVGSTLISAPGVGDSARELEKQKQFVIPLTDLLCSWFGAEGDFLWISIRSANAPEKKVVR